MTHSLPSLPKQTSGPRTAAAAPAPVAIIQLLTLGRLHLHPSEIPAVFLHRHMLSLYLAVLFVLIALDSSGAAGTLPIEQRGGIVVIATVVFMLVLGTFAPVLSILRKGRGPVRLHMSPMLFVASLCSVTTGESLVRMMMVSPNDTLGRLVLLFVFHYIIAEISTAILAHTLLPLIIGDVRGLPIRKLAETDPALWSPTGDPTTAPSTPPEMPARPQVDGFLVAAGISFPFHSLLHLQAEGNYVRIRATDRNELLPGPLSVLVAQLPPALGRQVHRSHWVAAAALHDWQAEGREITLHLANRTSVPVAVTRRHEVRDWLTGMALPKRNLP